jgi:Urease alpha-subunit, N-terminal domain
MIVSIGKAGKPDVMGNVSPKMIIGSSMEVITGKKLIGPVSGIDAVEGDGLHGFQRLFTAMPLALLSLEDGRG